MDKLIEGLESIKVLFKTKAKQSENASYWEDFAGITERAIKALSKNVWHNAEKDPPKETDCYIVRIDYGVGQMTTMREYVSSEGKWLKSIEEKLTHWMPLPEPPKEGGQE